MSAEGMNVVCWGVGAMTAVVLGFGALCAVYSVVWNRDTDQKLLNLDKVSTRDNAAFGIEAKDQGKDGACARPQPQRRKGERDERHELRRVMASAIFTRLSVPRGTPISTEGKSL
jgi:hypothetical protein